MTTMSASTCFNPVIMPQVSVFFWVHKLFKLTSILYFCLLPWFRHIKTLHWYFGRRVLCACLYVLTLKSKSILILKYHVCVHALFGFYNKLIFDGIQHFVVHVINRCRILPTQFNEKLFYMRWQFHMNSYYVIHMQTYIFF